MFCNNKSGQVEYHDYCWEQTDKIGVIHSKEIVNMSNTGNIQLAPELSVAVQTIKTAGYALAMGYDNMHRITSKSQHLTQQNLQFNGTLNVGYDLSYTYGTDEGKKFQLADVSDVNYRTEETPGEGANVKNNHAYEYDANGNLIYVNTSREKKDGESDEKAGERKLRWDEENRLLSSDDNGFVTNYWYDADGERTAHKQWTSFFIQ